MDLLAVDAVDDGLTHCVSLCVGHEDLSYDDLVPSQSLHRPTLIQPQELEHGSNDKPFAYRILKKKSVEVRWMECDR